VLLGSKGHDVTAAEFDPKVSIMTVTSSERDDLEKNDAFEVFDNVQFSPFPGGDDWWDRQPAPAPASPPPWARKSMRDVMRHNRAEQAWSTSTGKGVTIAVVDTGTDLTTGHFPHRSTFDKHPAFPDALRDDVGHGSMCAAIACGTDEGGGKYRGVAPNATLLTARSTLDSADLYVIYQGLLREKRSGAFPKGLVVSNSFGLYTCTAPTFPNGHPYVDLIRLCVANDIVFVFAAGNNHGFGLCKHPAPDDGPNTIWAANSIDEVITVGTVGIDESNQVPNTEHSNSSRGPGQWCSRKDKPDVVAPTYGEVVWGAGYRTMEWWGTSGACPQVAGLVALLLSEDPTLKPAGVRDLIRKTARPLTGPASCVGSGIIDAAEAISALTSPKGQGKP
jgi:subtilisin family serine protease